MGYGTASLWWRGTGTVGWLGIAATLSSVTTPEQGREHASKNKHTFKAPGYDQLQTSVFWVLRNIFMMDGVFQS